VIAITFAALFALDFVWVGYTRAIGRANAIGAGAYASLLILLSGTAAISYTHDPYMLIPAALGAFTGTWCAMKWFR